MTTRNDFRRNPSVSAGPRDPASRRSANRAQSKKTNKKPGKVGRIALGAFAALLLAILVTTGIGMANACLLRIRRAEVVLDDLPQGFDGVTILYASDIDLCGLNTPERVGALFNQLQSLQPDILILGGDYNATSLLDVLNRPEKNSDDVKEALESRSSFFHYIEAFQAPLGKYAIASTEDLQWQNLRDEMTKNRIRPLFNERVAVHAGGDTLWLAGLCGKITNLNDVGKAFSRNECVVAIAESPDILSVLMTSEASDSGQWTDLLLCGHTHGGQICLFGRTALSLTDTEQRLPSGWSIQNGTPMLTTQGVGCEGLNLRLGTEPEVWLIKLIRG